jgi:uncharacterized coiled-coil protein SlyX
MLYRTSYYTLIGSLPALPRSFEEAEHVPISWLKLEERLKMLEPRDAQVIHEMGEFLVWERQPLEQTDEEIVRHYEKFLNEVDNRFAQKVIGNVLTIRTVLAGLRCRRLQLAAPCGVAPIAAQIARNWNHPDFRLGGRFPWIAAVEKQLNSDSPFDLERQRIDIAWRQVKRLADQHFFTFEAVVLYLMRWELVSRWTQRDAEVGQKKFEKLVSDAIGDFSDMFA